jgi:hypothetical protein
MVYPIQTLTRTIRLHRLEDARDRIRTVCAERNYFSPVFQLVRYDFAKGLARQTPASAARLANDVRDIPRAGIIHCRRGLRRYLAEGLGVGELRAPPLRLGDVSRDCWGGCEGPEGARVSYRFWELVNV